MLWLIAMLMAVSFVFAGAADANATAKMFAGHEANRYAHSQQAGVHCHTAGDMCCAHAISCCVVLNDAPARRALQAISHAECIDAGAQLLALPVPRPPPKSIEPSF